MTALEQLEIQVKTRLLKMTLALTCLDRSLGLFDNAEVLNENVGR